MAVNLKKKNNKKSHNTVCLHLEVLGFMLGLIHIFFTPTITGYDDFKLTGDVNIYRSSLHVATVSPKNVFPQKKVRK